MQYRNGMFAPSDHEEARADLVKQESIQMPKIITRFEHPPILIRSFDWCAHYDGEEEAGNYGWGRTEAEAIQDFKDYCADAHDARLAKAQMMRRWAGIHDETIAMVKAVVGID